MAVMSRPDSLLAVYPADALTIVKGEPASWMLKRDPRFFCRDCGTRLFIEVIVLKMRGLNGALLPAEIVSPPVSHELPVCRSARHRRLAALSGAAAQIRRV